MDLSNLSVQELRNLQEQILKQLKKREQQEVVKAREQILAIAQSVGIPLKELVNVSPRAKAPTGEARFRNPANADQQWTGRGRQPQWIKDLLAKGKSLDDVRI